MQRVLDFIHDSLDLLPQPAAIYTEAGELIGRNKAAEGHLDRVLGPVRDYSEIADLFDFDEIRRTLSNDGPTSRIHQDYLLFTSPVLPFPRSPRPTLVLGTMHRGVTHETALLDHNRVLLMVRVNEAYEGMVLMLEAAQLQLSGVVEGQREVVAAVNQHTRTVFLAHYGNSPE